MVGVVVEVGVEVELKPDQRTKGWLIENNYEPWRVEQFNYWSKKKLDLYFICDYVGLCKTHERPMLGVQVTDGTNRASHRDDLLHSETKGPMLRLWLSNRLAFELHSWSKQGPAKSRKLWTLTREVAILSPTGQVSFEEVQ